MTAPLWTAHAAGDAGARERLLVEHLGLVHHVARQLSGTLAAKLEYDELVSAGTMGLMAALDGFDPQRGIAFSTFAAPRIRGAILDELRRQDHVPRSVRRKTREIARARETLAHAHGRAAEDGEIAGHLGVDPHTLWRWQTDAEGTHQLPLDGAAGDHGQGAPAPIDVLAARDDAPDEQLGREQETARLRDALLALKEQERVVLSLYYFEELKLHEVASILGLTESRVSQVRTKALARLRTALRPRREQVA